MPVINRKRRAQAEPEPSPPPTRRRRSPSVSEISSVDENVDDDGDGNTQSGSSHDQMVKNLVRLALASEYSRQPIRRTDITTKVMAPNTGRQFKHVFAATQEQLRIVFGMELTELPQREKVTVSQKRAAARSSQSSSTSKSYILTSTLPARYRKPSVLSPPQIPSSAAESSYIGLTTFVLSLIYLSPSSTLSESRLGKHLKRMNADNYVLNGEKTEKVLKRMEKENYIIKIRERDGGGEETIDYIVGPRGRVEVADKGVAGLVRSVYAKRGAEAEELDRRLARSLGDVALEKRNRPGEDEEPEGGAGDEADGGTEIVEDEPPATGGRNARKQARRSSGRNQRRGREEEEEEEEEEEDEDEDGEEEEEGEDEDEDEDDE